MRVNKIVRCSTTEVEGHFSDLIYFQGCLRKCPFCFNPETRNFNVGLKMSIDDILANYSSISDVVVLTGGEPLAQDKGKLLDLIEKTDEVVVLETACFDHEIYEAVDWVLFSIKTRERNMDLWNKINSYEHITPVIVIGHKYLDKKGLSMALHTVKKDIELKPAIKMTQNINGIYKLFENRNREVIIFEKIRIS